jgi:hypothetical protein
MHNSPALARVFVVFDDVDDGQLPQRRHIEALVNLTLVNGTVTEVADIDLAILGVFMSEGQTGTDRNLRADDAMAAEELLLAAEHVHRSALALGITPAPAG